jgi:translation initiation factor IF-2
MDKPEADPDRVKNDLAKNGVLPEDWGGDTLFVHVSARTGQGRRNPSSSVRIRCRARHWWPACNPIVASR